MQNSLSSLVDNLFETNNKKSDDEFTDKFRFILTLLSHSVDNLSEINKKIEKSENKFNNNFRDMQTSLSYLVNYLSVIDKKDEFSDSFRLMQTLLSCLVNYLSVINNKKIELENKYFDNFRKILASLS